MARRQRSISPLTRTRREGHFARRTRTAPRNVPGSTARSPCVIFTIPRRASRRAAERAGSSRSRQCSPPMARAASDGHMEPSRPESRSRIDLSSAASSFCARTLRARRRHASEQWRTCSQSRSHFLRHSIGRPQIAQGFDARSGPHPPVGRSRCMLVIEGPRNPGVLRRSCSGAGSTLRACLSGVRQTCSSQRQEACTARMGGSSSIPGVRSRGMWP